MAGWIYFEKLTGSWYQFLRSVLTLTQAVGLKERLSNTCLDFKFLARFNPIYGWYSDAHWPPAVCDPTCACVVGCGLGDFY